MVKINPIDIVKSVHGRISPDSDFCFCTQTATGKIYTAKRRKKINYTPSPAQTAHFSKFGGYGRQAAQWIREHKGTQAYEDMRAEYKNQHTIGTFIAYVTTKMMNNPSFLCVDKETKQRKPATDVPA